MRVLPPLELSGTTPSTTLLAFSDMIIEQYRGETKTIEEWQNVLREPCVLNVPSCAFYHDKNLKLVCELTQPCEVKGLFARGDAGIVTALGHCIEPGAEIPSQAAMSKCLEFVHREQNCFLVVEFSSQGDRKTYTVLRCDRVETV